MTDEKDPNLQAPQEANTTKHINFTEEETEANHPDKTAKEENDSPTKKAWKELREENKKDRQ